MRYTMVVILGLLMLFIILACSNTIKASMKDKPLASGIMDTSETITELSAQKVAMLIKNEANYLALNVIRDLPLGKEIVSPTGALKRQVSLGKVMRVYSLMDNHLSNAQAMLTKVRLPENSFNDNIVKEILENNFQRDLSDRYIATVRVAGLGTIGYISVPVYSVYKDFHQPNWIDIKIIQESEGSVQGNSSKLSAMPIASLDKRILTSFYPDANVDEHLYWFADEEGESKLVRLISKGQNIFLFSEEDGSWYTVDQYHSNEISTQMLSEPRYLLNSQRVSITPIKEMP